MKILGIDIGTTSITALLLNTENSAVESSCTLKNDSFITGKSFERLQSPQKIIETVKCVVAEVCKNSYPDAIGVTGQMHGILYLDKDNKPCSPLMIWQDERGNEVYENDETYAEFLTRTTGIRASTGFGLTTHFYNLKNNLVPKEAVMLSTIHDYLCSILTATTPVTHSSDAASLGFFDLKNLCFDEKALETAGISPEFLPKVIKSTECIGKTDCDFLPDNIPVGVAIGDNQASFLGSVADPRSSVLVNVGTGSQVSFLTKTIKALDCGEIRPLTDDDYIFVGSSLCGGRAYAILKNFFSMCADMLGGSTEDLYKKMDKLSENRNTIKDKLTVSCEFCGTRENPSKRGFIENIGDDNFTPKNLVCGFLDGVCNELWEMYSKADSLLITKPQKLVCSGNGLRKSQVWRQIFTESFGIEAELPKHSEEASVGACVFGSAACGIYDNIKSAQDNLLR